jgi:hypothetical protein
VRNEKAALQVYPNPATSKLNILSQQNISSLELWSLTGKLILKDHSPGMQKEINVSDFNSGVYILRVVNGKDVLTRKILVK